MLSPLNPKRSYLPRPLELIAATIARLLYRVRSSGSLDIPAQGGVLIIANHLSYVSNPSSKPNKNALKMSFK